MIFGNIRKFITDDILDKNEKIFTRGHLTLYKNNDFNNFIFKNIIDRNGKDYKCFFYDEKSHAVDEWGGISSYYYNNRIPQYDELVMDDIRVIPYKFFPTKTIAGKSGPYKSYQKDLSNLYKKYKSIAYSLNEKGLYRYYIYKGKVCKEEIIYVHFQKRKMDSEVNNKFFNIVPNQFVMNEDIDKRYLKRNVKHSYMKEIKKRIAFYFIVLKRKIIKP